MKKCKGFTLVEVLIVVVIVAVIAALILPRLLGQSEKAYLAEAHQMLGVLRKAYIRTIDLGRSAPAITNAENAADMEPFELKAFPSNGHFTYSCVADGVSCTATRKIE